MSLYEKIVSAWEEGREEEARALDNALAEEMRPIIEQYQSGYIAAHELINLLVIKANS